MALELLGDALQWIIAAGLVLAGILVILIWKKDKTKRITFLRFFIQLASLFAIFSSLLILAQWPSLVIGVIVGVTIIFGRFFCGWICPFGLYMDFITLVRKGLKIRYRNLSERSNRALHKLRYGLAGFVFLIPLFYGALKADVWRSFLVFQGPFKPLIVYFLGPLEPLVIPWPGAVTYNGYSLSYPYIREIMLICWHSIFRLAQRIRIYRTNGSEFLHGATLLVPILPYGSVNRHSWIRLNEVQVGFCPSH